MSDYKLIKSKILQRVDSEYNWNNVDPVLSSAEIVFSRTKNGIFAKLGDGRKYSETPFIQSIKVDEDMVSALGVMHVSQQEYAEILRDGAADPNTLYVVSSDMFDMCGEQIKNIAPGTDLSDAVTVEQLQILSSNIPLSVSELENDTGYLSSIPSEYRTYESTVSSLSGDGYATMENLENQMQQISWISAIAPSAFENIEEPAASTRSIQQTLTQILNILKGQVNI